MSLADLTYEYEDEDILFDLSLLVTEEYDTTSISDDGHTSHDSRNYSHSSASKGSISPSDDDSICSLNISGNDKNLPKSEKDCNDCKEDDVNIFSDLPVKRKRRRYPNAKDAEGNWLVPRVPLPRILKSDIRRSYGLMFANVYNSVDYDYMTKYLRDFVSEDFTYRFSKFGITKTLKGSKDLLGQFWFERMNEAPDILFNFDAGKIKVRSDGTAVLSGRFTLSGTRMGVNQQNGSAPDTASLPNCPWENTQQGLEVETQVMDSNSAVGMTPEECHHDVAHRFEVGGELSLHMDSNYRIELVDMAVILANIVPLPNMITV